MLIREVLFGLHEMKGIGWRTIEEVVKYFKEDLYHLPQCTEAEINAMPLPADKKRGIYQGSRVGFIQERLALYERQGYQYVTAFDHDYPNWLKEIIRRPWVMYWIGDYSLLDQPVLSIVGTRVPTAYGKRVARQLASDLSAAGWHVASGLARGIDSEVHLGALEGRGKTIAVLGSPIDTPYPYENTRLFERIRHEGLLLSEYPIGTMIKKGMFPERNRIISGIAMGVVVVEADLNSGSLITAQHAIEQNREVFAIPGPISSPKSAGTNDLIRNSSGRLVCSAEQIIQEFEFAIDQTFTSSVLSFPDLFADEIALNEDERLLLAFLSDLPVTFDRLYELTQFDFGHLHSVLISLLMKKKIEQQPGSSYILLY